MARARQNGALREPSSEWLPGDVAAPAQPPEIARPLRPSAWSPPEMPPATDVARDWRPEGVTDLPGWDVPDALDDDDAWEAPLPDEATEPVPGAEVIELPVTPPDAKVSPARETESRQITRQLREAKRLAKAAEKRAGTEEKRADAAETRAEAAEARVRNLEKRLKTAEAKAKRPAPRRRAAKPAAPKTHAGAGANGALDLNGATFEALRGLGLSVNQSARFIGQRDEKGGFSAIEDLDDLYGLPSDVIATLKQHGAV